MTWNWDTTQWKRSTKVLLGIATIWPVVYMFLFIGSIFSMILLLPLAETKSKNICGQLDVLQLDRKIREGQIKELRIRSDKIIAKDRVGTCEFETFVRDESTRREIIIDARELVNGQPRVEKIDESASEPQAPPLFVPFGFGLLMIFHFLTMLLMMASLPLYVILAIKNDRLDQNMRIIWVVLACTVGMVSNIVYWYLYVWRKPPAGSTPPPVTA